MLTRLRLAANIALIATLAASVAYAQNPAAQTKGARGGGGGGGGFGGPGGPGGGGGFGGPGGGGFGGPGGPGGPGGRPQGPANDSAERLLQIVAVQEDLKVDEKTVAKFKSLGEDAAKERTKRSDAVTKAAAAQAAAMAAQEKAAMAAALAESGIVVDPKTLNANNNNNRGGRGGPGGGQNMQFQRQMMAMAMDALQVKVDAAFLKLLNTKQKDRLKQIILQMEGARAFTTPNQEVVSKLGLTEEQLTNIQTLNNELRQTQRASMQEFFTSFAAANNIDMTNNNNNGGGRGGPGGGGRGGFGAMGNMDEATRAKFTTAMGDFQAKSSDTTMAAIGGLLTKAQKAKYSAMIGEKFDVSKLRQAPGGPGGPGAPGAPGTPAATAATKAATPAAATPAKKGLGSTRGDDN